MPLTAESSNSSVVSRTRSEKHRSEQDLRHCTYPWGIDPVVYLENIRKEARRTKYYSLRQSLTAIHRVSSQENVRPITQILEYLEKLRQTHSKSNSMDLDNSTRLAKELMLIINDLLLRVVHQIGQTNVQTPTFQSVIAYIRNLIHTRSAHMRQSVPGILLISWYEVADLMSSIQNEPELRVTHKKAEHIINIAHDTAAWAYKHLTTEFANEERIGFIDRSSIPYTYE